MLSFEQQEKILTPILKKQSNKRCADCDSPSPTWASLDFGVFLCSNCSGAHRALGPTITRVKSTKLDKWNTEWISNMKLGNQQINKYWQGDSASAALKKAKCGAALEDFNRYVQEKYIRKRFITEKTEIDPLTAFKNGTWKISQASSKTQEKRKQRSQCAKEKNNSVQAKEQPKKNLATFDLLDVDFQATNHVQCKSASDYPSNVQENGESQEFGDFISGNENISTERNETKSISFDQLMNQPQSENIQKQPQNNFQPNYPSHNNLMQFHQRPHHQTHSQQHYGQPISHNQQYMNHGYNGYPPLYNQQYQQPQPQYQYQHQTNIQNFTLQ